MINKIIYAMAMFSIAVLLLNACTKTEYTDFDKRSQNRILEYTLTNVKQATSGAIDQANNTITVYIPYYIGVEYLIADIQLDEGAVLLDANGNEINLDGGLEPVAVGAEDVQYTVKGSDGTSRTYTLIIEILPYPSVLAARYGSKADDTSSLNQPVHGIFTLYGNFESTSTNAKFYLTDRETGVVYDNFFKVTTVMPGSSQYTMTVNILSDAKAGVYDVKMEHQGRTTQLRPATLYYNKPTTGLMSSSSAYAPGDTITFSAMGFYPSAKDYNGVFLDVDRMYLKFKKEHLYQAPEGFPESLYEQQIEMKIVKATREEVKAIFPDAPAGVYYNTYYRNTSGGRIIITDSGFGFYFDFKEGTGWGKDNLLATSASMFTIKPKSN